MIADQNFYDTCFTIFYPTASATVYGRRPKFFRAKHSATAEGENWAYGPTLGNSNLFAYFQVTPPMVTFCEVINGLQIKIPTLIISQSKIVDLPTQEELRNWDKCLNGKSFQFYLMFYVFGFSHILC